MAAHKYRKIPPGPVARQAGKLAVFLGVPILFRPAGLAAGDMASPTMLVMAAANILIVLAYFSIPLFLVVFVNRRKDIPFSKIFILSGAFILACGTTHLVHVIALWTPVDELQAGVDTITAVISVATAILMWPLLPRLLAIPSPEQLRSLNRQLIKEKETLEDTQAELRRAYAGVEKRVAERTADLARANISLQAEIQERTRAEQQIREKTEELDRIFTLSLDLLCIADLNGTFIRLNPAWEHTLGFRLDELEGHNYMELVHPDDLAATERTVALLNSGLPVIDFTNRYRCRDGSYRWIEWRTKPFHDNLIYAAARDITDRKQAEEDIRQLNATLEQRVQERTAELSLVNQELESFSYSVSHDLRAPLRAMDGFSAALLADYSAQLDEKGRHFLERIQVSSRRMGQLINDLLSLSRITRLEFNRQPVDLSDLSSDIAESLLNEYTEHPPEFEIAAGLTCTGDLHLLRIAVENLLSNACKFSSQQAQPRVQVGLIEQNGETVYFVRDNGVGFDLQYAGKLFAPFQRLHTVQEFPGTGIGLVTVQRIIHRHGGRIWPESALGAGATFYFTLG